MNPTLNNLITAEHNRQNTTLNLIASENITSPQVHLAVASDFSHKYAEGEVGKRYYKGNTNVDQLENLTKDLAKQVFKLPNDWDVCVQALSGSNANLAVMLGLLNPGDTILSMFLPDGGHLSHGWSYTPGANPEFGDLNEYTGGANKAHIVSKLFNVINYTVDSQTNLLDYQNIQQLAQKYQPKLIIVGGSAYPRTTDFVAFKKIANSVNALLMADVAHEAGLIAAGVYPSPVGIADVVTMTTHKTLRAARGALILAKSELMPSITKGVLPGLQGGPFMHQVAGIAQGLHEALQPEFKDYAKNVISNAQLLAQLLIKGGLEVVTGGTDKHLILINVAKQGLSANKLATFMEECGIILNANTLPGDASGAKPSGIRIGTPFITTQGFKEKQINIVASLILQAINAFKAQDLSAATNIKLQVEQLMQQLD